MNTLSPSEKKPVTTLDIRRFVEENDDFGFEMKVAAEIKNTLPVDVFHGATYADPITEKPRQFDLRFRVKNDRKTLYFAVECKNIDLANPVVICGRIAESKENFHDIIVSRGMRNIAAASIQKATGRLYRSGEFVGKSVLKRDSRGRSNDSEIYDRWSQALASAHDLVEEASKIGSGLDTSNFGAVFPWIVVPDGALWAANYDGSGRLTEDPKPSNRCRYFVGHNCAIKGRSEQVCLSHVEFLTFQGLKDMLFELRLNEIDWDTWIPQKIRDLYRGE